MIGESVLIPELEGVDGLVFDLEGTLYVGDRPVAGAAASIATLRARGMPLRFLTNTTTCAHDALTVKLEGMGFEVSGDEVFCAPTVAGRFLLENDASAWLLVSPAALPDFDGVRTDPDNPDYVVVGDLGDDWTFALLNRAFVLVRERGAGLIGLVRSRYWLSADGARLDVGPFVVALEYATGRAATIFGKPERAIFETVLRTMGLQAGSVAMVGDDPITDVAAAAAVGMRTVLVRTGKYREGAEDPSESAGEAIGSADVVVDSVAGLLASARLRRLQSSLAVPVKLLVHDRSHRLGVEPVLEEFVDRANECGWILERVLVVHLDHLEVGAIAHQELDLHQMS